MLRHENNFLGRDKLQKSLANLGTVLHIKIESTNTLQPPFFFPNLKSYSSVHQIGFLKGCVTKVQNYSLIII